MTLKKDGVEVENPAPQTPEVAAAIPDTTVVVRPDDRKPSTSVAIPQQDAFIIKTDKKLTVLETHGYNLGRTIGSGTYATVKVAKSERHGGVVAVKIISKYQAPADYLKKFLPREIEVVKGLRHANLIRFLQVIETTHRVYIVMEYAENGSLLDIIRRDSYIDETRGRRWFKQLANVLHYCHERGVVHRDIKCENLLMDNAYNIKLSDFGFARGNMKSKNGIPPLSETFCGSYAYASPEILRGIPYQPQLSDIWSMGVVLYAIIFGRLPFDDSNYNQLLKQVQNKVSFPKEPKASLPCKSLITRILAPVRSRLRLAAILSDNWLIVSEEQSGSSSTPTSLDNVQSTSQTAKIEMSTSKSNIQQPVKLMTKDALHAAASGPRPGRRLSSEEEQAIQTIQPSSTTESFIDIPGPSK